MATSDNTTICISNGGKVVACFAANLIAQYCRGT